MIYEWIHELVSQLFIDYVDLPTYFQPLIVLFELWGVFIFFTWALYPFVYIVKLVKYSTRSLFPSNKPKRDRRMGDWVE